MLDFVIQEPFVPEGVILNVSISVYEAPFVVPYIERVAKLLYATEHAIQKAEYEAEKHASNG